MEPAQTINNDASKIFGGKKKLSLEVKRWKAFHHPFLSDVGSVQGDQIGQIFNIWLLFTWVYLKFYLNKQFQDTVCCTYFNIQKQFDATMFAFQFELLLFGYSFGYISKNWAIFFKLLVTLDRSLNVLRSGFCRKFRRWRNRGLPIVATDRQPAL